MSIVVALADKIDSLVAFFAVNEKPTGSRDPFALRRAALGIIRMVLENELRYAPDQPAFKHASNRSTESKHEHWPRRSDAMSSSNSSANA